MARPAPGTDNRLTRRREAAGHSNKPDLPPIPGSRTRSMRLLPPSGCRHLRFGSGFRSGRFERSRSVVGLPITAEELYRVSEDWNLKTAAL